MTEITTLFWDVGGVLLTNGWDRAARNRAAQQFALDWDDFQERHELVVADLEIGRLSLDEYLVQTVFYRPRPFTQEAFTAFMLAQSHPYPEPLTIARELARAGKYLMATLNNESVALNQYRIDRFRLREIFSLFLSSGFLGVKKPEHAIYQMALHITQRRPEACLFIDDRALNLECAQRLGMQTIHYHTPTQLRQELLQHGVTVKPD